MKHVLFFSAVVCILAVCSYGQVPKTMSYQGLLTNPSGSPVANGTYSLQFGLFDSSSGGNQRWSENQTSIDVNKGRFSVTLGSVTPLNLQFDRKLYLEVTALSGPGISGTLTFAPRSELTSAPYAFRADTAEFARAAAGLLGVCEDLNAAYNCPTPGAGATISTAGGIPVNIAGPDGLTVNGSVGIGTTTLSPQIKLEAKGSISVYGIDGNTSLFFGREQSGLAPPATDFGEWGIQYWSGGLNFWKPSGSSGGFGNNFLFLKDNGNVGIGTATPSEKLQVSGGNALIQGVNNFQAPNDEAKLILGDGNHYIKSVYGSGGGVTIGTYQVPDGIVLSQGTGNVGIGTPSPGAKLEVAGQIKITGGTPGSNKVLTSNAVGLASWQTLPAGGDNLGNHTATTTLNMNTHAITNITSLDFALNQSIQSSGQDLMIFGTTKFGIGTPPSVTLDVAGSGQFSGNLTVNGSSVFNNGVTIAGNLSLNGDGFILSSGTWTNSDKRYKKNIEPLESPLPKIMKIRGVRYDYDREKFPGFKEGKSMGFIAQELREVFPEAVMLKEDGYYAVNYDEIIPVLAEAMKEQQKEIEELRAVVKSLVEQKGDRETKSPGNLK